MSGTTSILGMAIIVSIVIMNSIAVVSATPSVRRTAWIPSAFKTSSSFSSAGCVGGGSSSSSRIAPPYEFKFVNNHRNPLSVSSSSSSSANLLFSSPLDDFFGNIFGKGNNDNNNNNDDDNDNDNDNVDDDKNDLGEFSLSSFQKELDKRQQQQQQPPQSESVSLSSSSSSSVQQVGTTTTATQVQEDDNEEDDEFSGYDLRDVIYSKYGECFDVEFQRVDSYGFRSVYLNILPFRLGGRKFRHETEYDYLCHLQAVVEILVKYDQLDYVLAQLFETNKKPRAGTSPLVAVPLRLDLTPEQVEKILG